MSFGWGTASFDVKGPSSAVNGNLASFNGTSGYVIMDSGISTSSLNTATSKLPTSTTSGHIASFSNNTGTIIDSGIATSNLPLLNTAQQWTGNNEFVADGTVVKFQVTQSGGANSSLIISPGGTAATTTLTSTSTVNGRVISLPDATDTLVGRATTDVVQNKSIDTSNCAVVDHSDHTKQVKFNCSSNTTGCALTIFTQQATSTNLIVPAIGSPQEIITSAATQTITAVKTFSSGLQFGTFGGTPTTLNHYEEGSFTAT